MDRLSQHCGIYVLWQQCNCYHNTQDPECLREPGTFPIRGAVQRNSFAFRSKVTVMLVHHPQVEVSTAALLNMLHHLCTMVATALPAMVHSVHSVLRELERSLVVVQYSATVL